MFFVHGWPIIRWTSRRDPLDVRSTAEVPQSSRSKWSCLGETSFRLKDFEDVQKNPYQNRYQLPFLPHRCDHCRLSQKHTLAALKHHVIATLLQFQSMLVTPARLPEDKTPLNRSGFNSVAFRLFRVVIGFESSFIEQSGIMWTEIYNILVWLRILCAENFVLSQNGTRKIMETREMWKVDLKPRDLS